MEKAWPRLRRLRQQDGLNFMATALLTLSAQLSTNGGNITGAVGAGITESSTTLNATAAIYNQSGPLATDATAGTIDTINVGALPTGTWWALVVNQDTTNTIDVSTGASSGSTPTFNQAMIATAIPPGMFFLTRIAGPLYIRGSAASVAYSFFICQV